MIDKKVLVVMGEVEELLGKGNFVCAKVYSDGSGSFFYINPRSETEFFVQRDSFMKINEARAVIENILALMKIERSIS